QVTSWEETGSPPWAGRSRVSVASNLRQVGQAVQMYRDDFTDVSRSADSYSLRTSESNQRSERAHSQKDAIVKSLENQVKELSTNGRADEAFGKIQQLQQVDPGNTYAYYARGWMDSNGSK